MNGPRTTPRWPWVAFAFAAIWVVLIRVPLILNAGEHLDSDLAVDGLTLLETTQGHFRWHYPGTPFMGIGAVFLSLPQALIWGPSPATLVSGGTLAYLGLLAATFWMAWRVGGPAVAGWSLIPLTFASTGALWLSARITGGHLVAAAWQAGAFAIMAGLWANGGRRRAFVLGLWCGFGLYLDSMLSVTIVGLLIAALTGWILTGMSRKSIVAAALFLAGFAGGVWPRPVGAWLEPQDAYGDQFTITREPELLVSHSWLLAQECLPRLIAGHKLPGLETDPDPVSFPAPTMVGRRRPSRLLPAYVTGLTLALAAVSAISLAVSAFTGPTASRVVCLGILITSGATLGGFVVNRNIFNSDNYRYLVGLLGPLALGLGLAASWLRGKGPRGRRLTVGLIPLIAVVMTTDSLVWYSRFGWIDRSGLKWTKAVDDPTLEWFREHPEVTWIEGGYWDVYRLAFLTGGKVRGVPFPVYPNRFPEWGRPKDPVILARRTPEGSFFQDKALRDGYTVVMRARGLSILAKP